MSRDTVIYNFRKGFDCLKEAFEAIGYRVAENEWAPAPQLAARCETAVVNLYEAIRHPWDTVRLHRRLRAAGVVLSDERRHAADDFDLSTKWAGFTDMDDCLANIRRYLDHFDLAHDIAEAADTQVVRDPTYEQRARNLVAAATSLRGSATS